MSANVSQFSANIEQRWHICCGLWPTSANIWQATAVFFSRLVIFWPNSARVWPTFGQLCSNSVGQTWPKSANYWPNSTNLGRTRADTRFPEQPFGNFGGTFAATVLDLYGSPSRKSLAHFCSASFQIHRMISVVSPFREVLDSFGARQGRRPGVAFRDVWRATARPLADTFALPPSATRPGFPGGGGCTLVRGVGFKLMPLGATKAKLSTAQHLCWKEAAPFLTNERCSPTYRKRQSWADLATLGRNWSNSLEQWSSSL